MSVVLYNIAKLVGEMTVLIILYRADLGRGSVLRPCPAGPEIVRLLVGL